MIETATLLIGIVVTSLLAVIVVVKNGRSITNLLFMFLAMALVGWSVTNYFSLHAISGAQTLFWIRWIMFFVVLQNTAFFLLVKVFPAIHFNFWHHKVYLGAILYSLMTAAITVSPYLFIGFKDGAPVPGPGMPLFMLHALLFVSAGIGLIIKYRQARGLIKTQLGYFLAGTLFMFTVLPIGNFIIPVVFKYNQLVFLSPLYSIGFTGFIALAIITKRLFDIRAIFARTIAYILLLAALAGIYVTSLLWTTTIFLEGKPSTVLTGVLAIILAFTFQPLRRFLEKVTDKLFYKDKYDTNTLLYNLALLMASTLRLEDVTHGILDELLNQMKVDRGAFILTEKNQVFDIKSKGYKEAPSFSEQEINSIIDTRNSLVFEEMEESDKLKEIFRKQEISLVVHLRTEGEQVGLLALGNKRSGDVYTEQDIKLLEILAPEAAVAIQNAKAYEEIRRFNITLQEEVDKATSELKDANAKLQELDKLKDEFVSLASHELRTPMTAIKGSLSTILEGYAGQVPPQAKDFLTAAYNENDRLIRLINNLLNISRIEAGRFTFTVTKVDMEKLVTEVINNLQMAAQEKSLYLKYEKSERIPLVLADMDKVKEVIINFIGNALKFTHKGGVTVTISVKDNKVVTGVTDTGSGIAKEDQSLLFKKFSQVQAGYSRQTGGTGLGLYISKQIVEGLGGKIWLESTLGQGSTFYFSLPIAT